MNELQSEIFRGEDRPLIVRIAFKSSREPFDLTGWTKITAEFRKSDRSILELSTVPTGGIKASSTHESVIYTAVTEGVVGNSILLVFDGVKTIATVISDWNIANASNQVSSNATNTAIVPAAINLQLVGGIDAVAKIQVINLVLGKISISLSDSDTISLKTGSNQSFKVIIDKGTPPAGDRRIVLFDSALDIKNADV